MSKVETHLDIAGPVGNIEAIMEMPTGAPLRGVALVAHPHPVGGGANTNKVVHTLAKTFLSLGYAALRPNFRGVGKTAGEHDEGVGETDDLLAALEDAHRRLDDPECRLPVALAGFSFGAYCQTRLARRLRDAGRAAERLALVGVAAGFIEGARVYATEAVPVDTLVIHGAADTLVPLANVLTWAEPQNLPVVVIPGADHFFHRRLTLIRDIILRAWRK
ncbi:MAG: alpha/beta hydrolase [Zoogloeaceae bacterium]|jgi:alpha/beta superfamily hydrolase|nr:alpha/beta hydrolase [Zoogloeaceae bacterium]